MYKKEQQGKIGCLGWSLIITLFLILFLGMANSKNDEEQENVDLKLEAQALDAQFEEEKEKKKAEEDLTKLKLTDEMIRNNVGESVDIYGVTVTISKPEEIENKVKQNPQLRERKAVQFGVTVQNNRSEIINLWYLDFTLIRDTYIHTEGSLAKTKWAWVYSEEMEPYTYGVDNVFNRNRESIPPGGKITGTVSYFLNEYDANLAYKPNSNETNFTLVLDGSDLPFIHSFEDNKIKFYSMIGWNSHNHKLVFN